jgi:hypothetical protein
MMIKAHVNPVVKEYLLGHNLQLDKNYFRPNFADDIVPEYLKALDLLTLDESNRLQRRLAELTLKNTDNEYLLRAKFAEKENEISILRQDNSLHSDAIIRLGDKIDQLMGRIHELEKR